MLHVTAMRCAMPPDLSVEGACDAERLSREQSTEARDVNGQLVSRPLELRRGKTCAARTGSISTTITMAGVLDCFTASMNTQGAAIAAPSLP